MLAVQDKGQGAGIPDCLQAGWRPTSVPLPTPLQARSAELGMERAGLGSEGVGESARETWPASHAALHAQLRPQPALCSQHFLFLLLLLQGRLWASSGDRDHPGNVAQALLSEDRGPEVLACSRCHTDASLQCQGTRWPS